MTLPPSFALTLLAAVTVAIQSQTVFAQVCELPASVSTTLPAAPPPEPLYSPLGRGVQPFSEIPLGIGHLHYRPDGSRDDLPPGSIDWIRQVSLPLSAALGAAPWAWIAGGWILAEGEAPVPLSLSGFVETGYEEPSFVVTEHSPNGWFRIRYAEGSEDTGLAWVPQCALETSPAGLKFTAWADWFLAEFIGPLFVRTAGEHPLHAEPSADSAQQVSITGEYVLEALEARGSWMKVSIRPRTDYCGPTSTAPGQEGWMRWHSEDLGPMVWYFTRGC